LPIQNVQEAGEENNERAGEEPADSEEGGGDKINDQAKKGEEVGIDSRSGDDANNFIKQPFAAGSDSEAPWIREIEPGFQMRKSYNSRFRLPMPLMRAKLDGEFESRASVKWP
jgi:hypothetical protein